MPGLQAHSNMKGKSRKSFQANEAEANWRGFLVEQMQSRPWIFWNAL